jgi:hypothetical protein
VPGEAYVDAIEETRAYLRTAGGQLEYMDLTTTS